MINRNQTLLGMIISTIILVATECGYAVYYFKTHRKSFEASFLKYGFEDSEDERSFLYASVQLSDSQRNKRRRRSIFPKGQKPYVYILSGIRICTIAMIVFVGGLCLYCMIADKLLHPCEIPWDT
jgi:hypothetical protein